MTRRVPTYALEESCDVSRHPAGVAGKHFVIDEAPESSCDPPSSQLRPRHRSGNVSTVMSVDVLSVMSCLLMYSLCSA